MPRTPKRSKKIVSRDINDWSVKVMEATTGIKVPADLVEKELALIAAEKAAAAKHKNPAAVALGRLGGKKGGKARAEALTAKERSEIATKAVKARWKRHAKIKAMTKDGLTAAQIAQRLGISLETVTKSFRADEPLAT
jgi:DNA-binding NarL/FixJ family response regulator